MDVSLFPAGLECGISDVNVTFSIVVEMLYCINLILKVFGAHVQTTYRISVEPKLLELGPKSTTIHDGPETKVRQFFLSKDHGFVHIWRVHTDRRHAIHVRCYNVSLNMAPKIEKVTAVPIHVYAYPNTPRRCIPSNLRDDT